MKSTFIRYISHEIRNPLNQVMLGLDHLEEGMAQVILNANRQEIFGDIKEACRSCLNVLDDMLTSDKIGSGFLALKKHKVNLVECLSQTVEKFRGQVQHKRILSIYVSPFLFTGQTIGSCSVPAIFPRGIRCNRQC